MVTLACSKITLVFTRTCMRYCKRVQIGKMCRFKLLQMLFLLASVELCKSCRFFGASEGGTFVTENERVEIHSKSNDSVFSPEQLSRLSTVEQECKKYDSDIKLQRREDAIPHMIVDDEHKILFCAVPKVASSNWKRVFIDALNITINGSTKIRDVHAKNLLPDLRHFSPEEQDYRLKTYFKFMFVRHPLERLLSAYRNKLENREVEWVPSTTHTIDSYGSSHQIDEMILRVKSEIASSNSNNTIAFSEFVDTLTDPAYRINHYNTHWKQYHKLCHPCFVRYNFIGKIETFQKDLNLINAKTGLNFNKHFDQTDRTTIPAVTNKYYKTLRPGKLHNLLNIYDVDLSMYEYDN